MPYVLQLRRMHIHAPIAKKQTVYFQRLDFSEDFILQNIGHHTLYILSFFTHF
jgi:hypothetical protein